MTLLEELFHELEQGHIRVETKFKEKYLTKERDQINTNKLEMGLSVDSAIPTPSEVLKVVSNITDIELDKIPSKDRQTKIVFSRHLYSYLVINYCKATSITAGIYINRSHATVIHSSRKIEELKEYGSRWEKECIQKGIDFFEQN